jgi:Cu/Ag efflux protein CusF
MKQKLTLPVLAAVAMFASPASFAQQDRPAQGADSQAQGSANAPAYGGRAVTLSGTIESVDRVTRTVTIKGEDGRMSSIRLGDNMPGLDRLEKGAKVTARYSEAMLVSMARSDASPQVQTQTTQQGPKAEQPAVQSVQQSSVVAQVTEIDREGKRVTLEAPNGQAIRLGVRDSSALRDLKVGDKVVANYIEAFALAIEPQDERGQTTGAGGQRNQ